MLWVTIFVAFIICSFCNCIYYVLLSRVFRVAKPKNNLFLEPLSIIIAAKNEAINLLSNLPKVLNQDYPHFEVIVVDDASTDNTLQVLKDFQSSHHHLKVVKLNASKGKKNALAKGIVKASSKHMLFTDADCYPATLQWAQKLSNYYTERIEIIVGYGAYKKAKGFLNKLIRFETLLTAFQYFGYAHLGYPYMGVGRNLSYKTSTYNNVQGFSKHQHMLSGDDDLFVSQASNRNNISVCLDRDAFTFSEPETTFKYWWNQKRRHITTASNYKLYHKVALGFFFLTNLLFWILLVTLCAQSYLVFYVFLIAIIRLLVYYFCVYRAAKKLGENDLTVFLPLYEIPLLFVQISLFIANIVSKPKTWT